MQITFLGATRTVTGSKYLLSHKNTNVLIDCGLFQGYKTLRLKNWQSLPIKADSIKAVLLTHAHIDHSGYIPLLVKNGFRGNIYCTKATRDLCSILLPDSGHLHEEEAKYANRKRYSKHKPALPLYTLEEAQKSLEYFKVIDYDKPLNINDTLTASFYYAGHILGSACIQVTNNLKSILFTGDLGRPHDAIMLPPNKPPSTDYLVIESTYGDRIHSKVSPMQQLSDIIKTTLKKGGVILIPSFAVGRAQSILYYLYKLKQQKCIPNIPIYIDSPMALNATELFLKHHQLHRLSEQESIKVCHAAQYIHSIDESMSLDSNNLPKIIISASGMASGGRILHHIKRFAPDHRNSIVFCGFQASGTRGDKLVRGESAIKMFGEYVPVKATVYQLDNTSVHADKNELINWVQQMPTKPKKIFITHGNEHAAEELKQSIKQICASDCIIPNYLDKAWLN